MGKKRRVKKGLAFILCAVLVTGMVPGNNLRKVQAATSVSYLAYDEASRTMKENVCDSATEVTSEVTSWGKAGQKSWYVAEGDITMAKRVWVYGEVHLILADNCNLKIETTDENGDYVGGIGISRSTYHLYIHAQSEGDKQGTLVCRYTSTSPTPYAALGDEGSITIDGGNITCEGNEGAGIGGSSNVTKGTIGTVTINGGTINATTSGFGAAIGSGANSASDGTVVINEGTINAESRSGAGIGGGSNNAGIVTITGGDITATGGGNGAGIGGGQSKTGTVTISGGRITAANTYQPESQYKGGGAGIGGGAYKNGTVIISGGEINATGNYGAGIGGGYGKNGFGSDITITGGLIKAVSQMGSGIGSGYYSGTEDVAEEKLTIENSPFIFASSGSGGMGKGIYKQDDSENWSNIISIDGSDGTVYGTNVTTAMDFEIAKDQTLLVPEGTTLAVGEGKTITNHGTIKVAGTMDSASANKVNVHKPKYKLITNGKLEDVTEEETTETGKIYYSTYGDTVAVAADEGAYEGKGLIGWTVSGAAVPAQRTSPLAFTMPANAVTVTALYGVKAPSPDLNGKVKVSADSIVISDIDGTETYGDLEFMTDISGGSWESESNGIFTRLTPDTEYTINVRYAGKDNYAASDAAQVTVKTKKWAGEVEKVTGLTATYGQTLNDVELPDGWTWKDSSVKLNSLGTTEYAARFAPSDTDEVDYSKVTDYVLENGKVYLDTSLTVTVTQAKPEIQWNQANATYTYTGLEVTAQELPTLSVTLQNNETYSGTFTYSYRKKDSSEAGEFISGLPKELGVYEVKAAVPESDNYTAAESDIMTLTIQYLENALEAVTTDKSGKEYSEWCPAEFYIKAPADYTISDKVDGTYSKFFIYNAESEKEQQEITYYLKNVDGQIAQKTLTAKIDRTAPDWNGDNTGINIKNRWWNSLLEEYVSTIYKGDSLDVNVKANDSQSGVVAYYYYVQDGGDGVYAAGDLDILAIRPGFKQVLVTGNGEAEKLLLLQLSAKSEGQLVYVYAVDAVGNRSDYICSAGIVFDNKAPTMKVEFQGGDILWDTSVTCWFHCTELGDYYYICKKAGEPAPTSITDFAEKISDVSKDADAEVDAWKAKDGIVTGEISSEGYSLGLNRYSQQLEITGLTANTDYVLYMVATDEAGNASDVKSLPFKTLQTKPHIEKVPKLVGVYGQSLSEMTVDDTDARVVAAQGSETEVSGTWSVKEEDKSAIPVPGTDQPFTLIFTPESDMYSETTCEVIPTVAKKEITVVIADAEKVYGEDVPGLTWSRAEGETLVLEDGDEDLGVTLHTDAGKDSAAGEYAITGTYNSSKYDVQFTGNGADGKSGILKIKRVAGVPNPPETSMNVDYSVKKVSDIPLTDWVWQDTDRDKELLVGTVVTAVAIYNGADKGNYETERLEIAITRGACPHKITEIVGAKEASYNEAGYTGDKKCKDCGALLEEGKQIPVVEPVDTAETTETANTTEAEEPVTNGEVIKNDTAYMIFTVKSIVDEKLEVECTKCDVTDQNIKTVTIPDTVMIDGKEYKVTSIGKNAFKKNKKVTKIVVGKHVKKIGKNAFKGCKKLKKLVVRSTKLTRKTIKKGAFNGISSKVVIKVPKKKKNTYKKLFRKMGLNKKTRIAG